jgi:hypothetical protein
MLDENGCLYDSIYLQTKKDFFFVLVFMYGSLVAGFFDDTEHSNQFRTVSPPGGKMVVGFNRFSGLHSKRFGTARVGLLCLCVGAK